MISNARQIKSPSDSVDAFAELVIIPSLVEYLVNDRSIFRWSICSAPMVNFPVEKECVAHRYFCLFVCDALELFWRDTMWPDHKFRRAIFKSNRHNNGYDTCEVEVVNQNHLSASRSGVRKRIRVSVPVLKPATGGWVHDATVACVITNQILLYEVLDFGIVFHDVRGKDTVAETSGEIIASFASWHYQNPIVCLPIDRLRRGSILFKDSGFRRCTINYVEGLLVESEKVCF